MPRHTLFIGKIGSNQQGSVNMWDYEEDFPYQIVEFISRGPKKSCKSVDLVPTNWLTWDKRRKKCACKFLSPPYNNDDRQFLER